ACVPAGPGRYSASIYRAYIARCRRHRVCVSACEAVGAINFQRDAAPHQESFDLVVDLRREPAFSQHAHPQGYFHLPAGVDSEAGIAALIRLRDLVGEFEKLKFFQYQQKICAHGRNETVGCDACVQVCSALASRSEVERQQIVVNPNLCVGCGACTTVCPPGALSFAYPRASEQGNKLRTVLST